MSEMEGGVQGARRGNWSIIRKQQARENDQNQSKKKILDYEMGKPKGISGWLLGAVGVSSRLVLLHASSWPNVLNAVAKGSLIHHGTTTARLFATLRLH
jgi:hypothetical protein